MTTTKEGAVSKTDHLAKAKDYIAKGEDYYRKAAVEIQAARETGWSWPAIGRELGRSENWLRSIVAYSTDPTGSGSPFGGEDQNQARYERHLNQIAKDPERLAEAITKAPAEVQRKVAKKLVSTPSVDPSLTHQPERKPRGPKSPEDKLNDAVFALWEVGELLMDQAPSGAERVRMTAMAEKAQRLSHGILQLLGTGEFEDEFRDLIAEVGAGS